MKVAFFGTSDFAIPALKALIASRHKVVAVITQPDRKKGRNLKLSPPPTKVVAELGAIPVFQPENASCEESVRYLRALGADIFVVIAFGQILKKEVLAIPKVYAINLHGSLLPEYRGAAPTNWAIINDERSSGVTIIRMNERMDEGDIIMKREVAVSPDDTNITLSETLSDIGATLILDALEAIEKGGVSIQAQDESLATYAPKLKKEDGLIDWSSPALKIHNRVRGLLPWPGAYTLYDGKVLKLLKTEYDSGAAVSSSVPGTVLDIANRGGIVVATGKGAITITHLQLEGKKEMAAAEFLRGHKIPAGHLFTSPA